MPGRGDGTTRPLDCAARFIERFQQVRVMICLRPNSDDGVRRHSCLVLGLVRLDTLIARGTHRNDPCTQRQDDQGHKLVHMTRSIKEDAHTIGTQVVAPGSFHSP